MSSCVDTLLPTATDIFTSRRAVNWILANCSTMYRTHQCHQTSEIWSYQRGARGANSVMMKERPCCSTLVIMLITITNFEELWYATGCYCFYVQEGAISIRPICYVTVVQFTHVSTFSTCHLYDIILHYTRPTTQAKNKLAAAQTKMERSMLNITYRDRKTNIWVREKTKVIDMIEQVRRRK